MTPFIELTMLHQEVYFLKNSVYYKFVAVEPYIFVALGGGAGAILRYIFSGAIPLPYSTLAVNILGCFLLGFLMYEEIYIGALSAQSRVLIAAGILGSFTTFSTFIYDAFNLPFLQSFIYITSNFILGLASVYTGRAFALYLARRD
jgi:CrcB protein